MVFLERFRKPFDGNLSLLVSLDSAEKYQELSEPC